eukprot:scaffold2974_cov194-Cylindrotheca_fusiformis.AAC.3
MLKSLIYHRQKTMIIPLKLNKKKKITMTFQWNKRMADSDDDDDFSDDDDESENVISPSKTRSGTRFGISAYLSELESYKKRLQRKYKMNGNRPAKHKARFDPRSKTIKWSDIDGEKLEHRHNLYSQYINKDDRKVWEYHEPEFADYIARTM